MWDKKKKRKHEENLLLAPGHGFHASQRRNNTYVQLQAKLQSQNPSWNLSAVIIDGVLRFLEALQARIITPFNPSIIDQTGIPINKQDKGLVFDVSNPSSVLQTNRVTSPCLALPSLSCLALPHGALPFFQARRL